MPTIDPVYLESLYSLKEESLLFRICFGVLRSYHDAQDCVQEFYFYAIEYCISETEDIQSRESYHQR